MLLVCCFVSASATLILKFILNTKYFSELLSSFYQQRHFHSNLGSHSLAWYAENSPSGLFFISSSSKSGVKEAFLKTAVNFKDSINSFAIPSASSEVIAHKKAVLLSCCHMLCRGDRFWSLTDKELSGVKTGVINQRTALLVTINHRCARGHHLSPSRRIR